MFTMCDLIMEAVIDSRNLFLASSVVFGQMPHSDLFNRQTQVDLDGFQSAIPNNFIQTLAMFRGLTRGNGLVSAYSTNWNLFVRNMTHNAIVYMKPQWYGDCNCATSVGCTLPSQPFLPGFVIGCVPLESFLRSTIECLYIESCINQMVSYIDSNFTLVALKKNLRFAMNVSINEIIQQMFIEHWSSNVSYESFFEQCHPISCSYSLIQRRDMLDVSTTLLGLHGGVTTVLRVAVPLAVRLWHKFMRNRRQTTSEVMPTNNHH